MYEDFQAVLDGKSKNKPVPYDAHEQATRGEHVPTGPDSPDKTDVTEYPKAVDHKVVGGFEARDTASGEVKTVGGHLEPVIATSAEHEAQLKEQANG